MIERFVWTINEAGDGVFRTAIEEFINLKAFLEQVAIDVFLADNDSILGNWGMNNAYFYRFEATALFTTIPWDKSNAFMDGPAYSPAPVRRRRPTIRRPPRAGSPTCRVCEGRAGWRWRFSASTIRSRRRRMPIR